MKNHLFAAVAALPLFLAGAAFAQADDPTTVDGLVVTGSPLDGSREENATLVQSVGRQSILERGGASLGEALETIPGVASSGFAAGAGRPVVRGMDANRVKILEDGLSSSDASDIGPDHGVPIDPLSAQKIEVVRGAASLRYGSQAIGGVVNAINDRIPTQLTDAPLEGEASATYGSGADTGEGAILLDGRAGQAAFHLDGFRRDAGDYDTPLGVMANSFFRGGGYAAGASYFFGHARTGLAVVHYDSDYGIPGEDSYIDLRQTKVMSGSAFNFSGGALQTVNLDLSYSDYAHDEIDPAGPDILSTFINDEFDSRAEALFGQVGVLSSSALGLQIGKRNFSALGEGGDYLSPTKTRSYAGFAFTETPLSPAVTLQGALRVERVDIEGTPASDVFTRRDFTPVSGSATLAYDPSDDLAFGVTVTSAARAPAQTELFARGAHDGPGTYETGDPNLDIERSNSLEATTKGLLGSLDFEGAVWAARFDGYIFGDVTGAMVDEDGTAGVGDDFDLKELQYRQGDARFRGAEAKVSFPLYAAGERKFTASLQADAVHAEFEGGQPVPRIPPARFGGGLAWTSGPFDASVTVMRSADQDRVPTGESVTEGFTNVDARIAWRPTIGERVLEIALVGRNLTDEVERNAVALNRDEVIPAGRDVRLMVRMVF